MNDRRNRIVEYKTVDYVHVYVHHTNSVTSED